MSDQSDRESWPDVDEEGEDVELPDSSEEEEEDQTGALNQDAYVNDGFVVPDDEEEEEPEENNEMRRPRRKRKLKKRTKRLRKIDDDDEELIRENLEISQERERRAAPVSDSDLDAEGDVNLPMQRPNPYADDDISDPGSDDPEGYADIFAFNPEFQPKPRDYTQKDIFEPAERKERYLTDEAEQIRKTDVPERLQAHLKLKPELTDEEQEQEAEWLTKRYVKAYQTADPDALKEKIQVFLHLLRVEKHDVPFIYTYRSHLLKPELEGTSKFWDLYRWDAEWGYLYSTKKSAQDLIFKAAENTANPENLTRADRVLVCPVPQQVCELFETSSAEDYRYELADLAAFIKAYTQPYSPPGATQLHHPLAEMRRLNIGAFIEKVGLTPLQLTENIHLQQMVHEVPKAVTSPQDAAAELASTTYDDQIKVLQDARTLLVQELCGLPWFRSKVRELYLKHVLLYTSPTGKGKDTLDIFHPQYRVKNIAKGKQVSSVKPDFWGDVLKAEREELIEVKFSLPWKELETDAILEFIKPYYTGVLGEEDEGEQEWDTFRMQVLAKALEHMYATLETQVKNELSQVTEEYILKQCQMSLDKMIGRAGFKFNHNEVDSLMAVLTTTSNERFGETAVVILKSTGEVTNFCSFHTLAVFNRDRLSPMEQKRYDQDKQTLENLLLDYTPQAIVVGANSLNALRVYKNLSVLVEDLANGSIQSKLAFQPEVKLLEPTVAALFAASKRSGRLYKEFNFIQKQAISLGRYFMDPLSETLQLAADPSENLLTSLPLHPLQRLVNQERLNEALSVTATELTCEVGIDIVRLVEHPHLRAPLSFVSGLGPIMATSLMDKILMTMKGKVPMRVAVLAKDILGPHVFTNCIGFIYIPTSQENSDPFDSTRIHPELYELATTVVKSALDISSSSSRNSDGAYVLKVFKQPKILEDLDLKTYADLHRADNVNLDVLNFIVAELTRPFHCELRPIEQPTTEELMYLCTGETAKTLSEGSIVQVKVIAFDERRSVLRCRLECGLDGSVDSRNIFENSQPTPEDIARLPKGQTLPARIIGIEGKEVKHEIFFRVRLSLLEKDITQHGEYVKVKVDDCFVEREEDWVERAPVDQESKRGKKYVARIVNHPKFKNIPYSAAIALLADRDIGELVFRPSSLGEDHLTCTWKFYDNVYAHLDIIEEGKPSSDMLGVKFHIGSDTYESLQEIVDRYIVPCEKHTKEAITHEKFKDNNADGIRYVESRIRKEKAERPGSIPYCFTILQEFPQFLVLCYMPKERLIQEYIKVKPKGLYFHDAYHPNMTFLISWFKRHYSDKTYQIYLSRSKAPAMDQTQHYAVPARLERPRTPIHRIEAPGTPRTPLYETPFDHTPHIQPTEWAGDHRLSETPYANDDAADRNYRNNERRFRERQSSGRTVQRSRSDRREPIRCSKCQGEGHMARDCRKSSARCYNCNEEGHLARYCPREQARQDSWGAVRPPEPQETYNTNDQWG